MQAAAIMGHHNQQWKTNIDIYTHIIWHGKKKVRVVRLQFKFIIITISFILALIFLNMETLISNLL